MKGKDLISCSQRLTTLTATVCLLTVLPVLSGQAKTADKGSALGIDDPGCRGCVSQAASMFALGKSKEAVELLRQWTRRCPHNAQFYLLLSTILLRVGPELEEAEIAAYHAVSLMPNSVAAHLQYALVLSANHSNLKAIGEFAKVTELDPSSYEAWSSLSTLYGELHEDDKAHQCAMKAADLEPSTKAMRLRTLKNLEHSGKTKEARLELRRLMGSGELSPESMQQLAAEAISLGAYDEAIEAAQYAAKAYPNSLAPLKLTALAQLCQHDYEGCLTTAQKMIAVNTLSGEAQSLEALALLKVGRLDEAEKKLSVTLNKQPSLPLALLGLGRLQFIHGDFASAADNLERCLEADVILSYDPEVSFTLAQALEKQGQNEFALSYYKQSMSRGLTGEAAVEAQKAILRLNPQPR